MWRTLVATEAKVHGVQDDNPDKKFKNDEEDKNDEDDANVGRRCEITKTDPPFVSKCI